MTNKRLLLPFLLLPGVGYLLLFFGFPLSLALLGSFGIFTIGQTNQLTLQHYQEIFSTRAYRDGLFFSLYLALLSTLFSVVISVPLAALLQRSYAGKKLFNALYKIPLVVPSIVAAFLVLTLLDQGGIASRLFSQLHIHLPKMVRDRWALGVLIAMSWKSIPFMTLIVGGAMASISSDLLHAARSLGAKPRTVFWRIQLPLALPGITAATLLVFIGGMGAFAIPNLLGPIYPTPLSVHMYENAFERNQWGLVSAMGTLLSFTSCLVLLAYYRLTRGTRQTLAGQA